jgi:hypothetical protein
MVREQQKSLLRPRMAAEGMGNRGRFRVQVNTPANRRGSRYLSRRFVRIFCSKNKRCANAMPLTSGAGTTGKALGEIR